MCAAVGFGHLSPNQVPGDAIKCDPERENCAVLTIAAQTANSIHIRVTFHVVTRYLDFPVIESDLRVKTDILSALATNLSSPQSIS